jgi:hypothetical protein
MEPEGSLLCSQKRATGFHPEPEKWISQPLMTFVWGSSNIVSSTSSSYKLPLTFRFYDQNCVCTSFIFYLCYTFRPSYIHRHGRPINNWRRLQIMDLFIMTFLPTSFHCIPLWLTRYPQHHVHKYTPQSVFCVLSLLWETNFHTCENNT